MPKKKEMVNHPDHYNKHKKEPLEDLKKARFYIERLISEIERQD